MGEILFRLPLRLVRHVSSILLLARDQFLKVFQVVGLLRVDNKNNLVQHATIFS
jgi:hypothetical protein